MTENNISAEVKKTQGKGLMGRAIEVSARQRGTGLLKHIAEKNIEVKKMAKVIVEKNGVFVIQPNLETSGIVQDPELKALVDAVLR